MAALASEAAPEHVFDRLVHVVQHRCVARRCTHCTCATGQKNVSRLHHAVLHRICVLGNGLLILPQVPGLFPSCQEGAWSTVVRMRIFDLGLLQKFPLSLRDFNVTALPQVSLSHNAVMVLDCHAAATGLHSGSSGTLAHQQQESCWARWRSQ